METQTSRHRHLVVFPVFVAALAFSFADVPMDLLNVLGSVTSIFGSTEDERFTFDSGVYGVIYAGGQLEEEGNNTVVLSKGSALLASDGIVRTTVRNVLVTSMHGAVHITRGTNAVTIAALTSPAVIQLGDQRMIVPVGMQWEVSEGIATLNEGFESWMEERLPKPLPISFVERKLKDLSLVRLPEDILPEATQFLPLDVLPEEEFLLKVSESHVRYERYEHILGVVRYAVEHGDTDRLEELLDIAEVTDALATDRGVSTVAVLLSQTDADTALRMLLMKQIISDEAVWLASAFHPAFRDVTWALEEPDVSTESYLTRAFLLPFSMFSPEVFSDFVLERFTVSLRGITRKIGNPDAFADHIVLVHMPLISRLEEKGYPQRAHHITQTLIDVISESEKPTEAMLSAKEVLLQRSRVHLSPLPSKREPWSEVAGVVVEPEPAPEPEMTLSPEEVEAKAYALLEGAGALFTIHSAISSYEGNNARVMDVLFSTETEDRAVSFTVDVEKLVVSSIEINGNTDFPYTSSFEGFIHWVRK